MKITAKKGERIYIFNGQVKRYDGLLPIKRIGRPVNVFYVMASGLEYQEFYTQLYGTTLTPAALSIN